MRALLSSLGYYKENVGQNRWTRPSVPPYLSPSPLLLLLVSFFFFPIFEYRSLLAAERGQTWDERVTSVALTYPDTDIHFSCNLAKLVK